MTHGSLKQKPRLLSKILRPQFSHAASDPNPRHQKKHRGSNHDPTQEKPLGYKLDHDRIIPRAIYQPSILGKIRNDVTLRGHPFTPNNSRAPSLMIKFIEHKKIRFGCARNLNASLPSIPAVCNKSWEVILRASPMMSPQRDFDPAGNLFSATEDDQRDFPA